jgi:DNA-binding MarR family transcriptional regulator
MDISASDITTAKLFKTLVSNGPSTVYSIANQEDIPQPTVHRIFKNLEKSGMIQVYEEDKAHGRRRIFYGPTVNGVLGMYLLFDNIPKENLDLELIFDVWLKEEKFFNELVPLFSANKLQNAPVSSKKIFKKFLKSQAKALREFEKYIDENGDIPFDYKVQMGATLLRGKNSEKFDRDSRELIAEMPGLAAILKNNQEMQNLALQNLGV